jgi:hypothetical protein
MAQYLIQDKDKAAFTNRINKLLKQMDPGFELLSSDFVDIPGDGGDTDMCIFATDDAVVEKLIDMMISQHKFSYKIKKVNLQEIVHSLKNQA